MKGFAEWYWATMLKHFILTTLGSVAVVAGVITLGIIFVPWLMVVLFIGGCALAVVAMVGVVLKDIAEDKVQEARRRRESVALSLRLKENLESIDRQEREWQMRQAARER